MLNRTQMIAIGLLAVSTSIWAHNPAGEVRYAVQFPPGYEPTIDGDCSDWDAIPGDLYWIDNADLYPFNHGQSEGVGRGDVDPSSFDAVIRVGWSSYTGQLYYCNSIYDDRHIIDRADSYNWWEDDSSECFFSTRHLSEQEVRDLAGENINTYWSFNYALPRLPDPVAFWMLIGMCIGCDWLDNGDNEWYTLAHTFWGEEFGESVYHYEHRIQPIDSWVGGLGADLQPSDITPATLSEGQIIHITFSYTDDDAILPDGAQGGPGWATRPRADGTWLASGDFFLEPINPCFEWDCSWEESEEWEEYRREWTSVRTESWGRIKAQF